MDSVILQDQNSTHYDNGDGTATVVVSDNLNYRSRGEWLEVDTYYLESIGDDAWSNYADDFPVTLVGGIISTPDGWWQVEGVYLGETKLWSPDFTNYGKIGDTVSYLTPWGVLRYTIRPDGYREEFVFDENPVAGLLVDGDALTVKYFGGIDSVVWSKDALGREYPVASTTTEKSISREDLYRAKYPLVLDPSGDPISPNGDSDNIVGHNGSYPYFSVGNVISNVGDAKNPVYEWTSCSLAMVMFDLTSLSGVSVTSARFTIYSASSYGLIPVVYGTNSTINPEAMTKAEISTTATTGTSLGAMVKLDSRWVHKEDANITSYVAGKVGSYANFGLAPSTIGAAGEAEREFYSRENTFQSFGRPTLNITYTAGTTYALTYDANGGANPPSAQTGGTTYTVSGIGSMTRAGYNFVAWNTAANGSGTSYAPSASITLSANTTLYAQWKINDSDALFFGAGL